MSEITGNNRGSVFGSGPPIPPLTPVLPPTPSPSTTPLTWHSSLPSTPYSAPVRAAQQQQTQDSDKIHEVLEVLDLTDPFNFLSTPASVPASQQKKTAQNSNKILEMLDVLDLTDPSIFRPSPSLARTPVSTTTPVSAAQKQQAAQESEKIHEVLEVLDLTDPFNFLSTPAPASVPSSKKKQTAQNSNKILEMLEVLDLTDPSIFRPSPSPARTPIPTTTPVPASQQKKTAQNSKKMLEMLEVLNLTDPSIFPPTEKHSPTTDRAKQLIANLKADLAPLPPITDRYDPETDLVALQALVYIVARHAKVTKPHWNETYFQEHLFELVMDRMPQSAVELFFATKLQDREPRKKLPDARSFLADFLVEVAHQKQAQVLASAGQLQEIYCSYCKVMTNHHISNCVKLTKRLCLNCFKFGHSSKFCTYKEAYPLEDTYCLMNGS